MPEKVTAPDVARRASVFQSAVSRMCPPVTHHVTVADHPAGCDLPRQMFLPDALQKLLHALHMSMGLWLRVFRPAPLSQIIAGRRASRLFCSNAAWGRAAFNGDLRQPERRSAGCPIFGPHAPRKVGYTDWRKHCSARCDREAGFSAGIMMTAIKKYHTAPKHIEIDGLLIMQGASPAARGCAP